MFHQIAMRYSVQKIIIIIYSFIIHNATKIVIHLMCATNKSHSPILQRTSFLLISKIFTYSHTEIKFILTQRPSHIAFTQRNMQLREQ